jgi:hypothetical protein
MKLDVLYHPSPLYIPVLLLIALVVRSRYCKQWPEMDKLVEIIAFSAGIYAASAMFLKAFSVHSEIPEMAWALFTGAAVTGFASVRGAWVVFSSIRPRILPEARANNSAQVSDENQQELEDSNSKEI